MADPNVLPPKERMRVALELRLAGVGYEKIAQQLHYAGPSGAYKAVQTELAKRFVESDAEARQLELHRLDQLLLGLYARGKKGDPAAVSQILKVMERRAKYLELDRQTAPADAPKEADPVDQLDARRAARRRANSANL